MRMPTIRKSDRGFSLAEVMVAFGILAIGMAGVATMLLMSMQYDQYSAESRDGDFQALKQIEDLRATWSYTSTFSTGVVSTAGYYYLLTFSPSYVSGVATTVSKIDIVVGWGGESSGRADCVGKTCAQDPKCCQYWTKITNFLTPKDKW
jgi:prepilin-type N-terminal cleavage/methylation domain-containing protein